MQIQKTLTALVTLTILAGCSTAADIQTSTDQSASSPDSTSASEVFEKQWAIDFTREQLMEEALRITHEYYEKHASGHNVQANFFFEDTVSDIRKEWETDLAHFTMGVFDEYMYDEINFVGGMSQEFMVDTLLNEDVSFPEGTDISICGIAMSEVDPTGCNYDNSVWFGYGENPEKKDLAFRNAVPHELFHTVQSATAGGHTAFYGMPIWFVEGGAQVVGYSIPDYLGYYSYDTLPTEKWYYLPNPATGLAFWTRGISSPKIPNEYYALGQTAVEYIIVNVGMEGLLNVTINMGNGMDFEEAFEEAIGKSVSGFYGIFDIAYAKMMEKDTGIFRTFENRLCPEEYGWDCSIDNYKGVEWWQTQPIPAGVVAPDKAENKNHDLNPHPHYTNFDLEVCEGFGPMAISSDYAISEDMAVSTQWYAAQSHLDTNADGIVCGPGDVL